MIWRFRSNEPIARRKSDLHVLKYLYKKAYFDFILILILNLSRAPLLTVPLSIFENPSMVLRRRSNL